MLFKVCSIIGGLHNVWQYAVVIVVGKFVLSFYHWENGVFGEHVSSAFEL